MSALPTMCFNFLPEQTTNMKLRFLKYTKLLLVLTAGVVLILSCNKDDLNAVPATPAPSTATKTIYEVLSDPNYSILKAAVDKAGLTATLSDSTAVYTFFAPTDLAFQGAFQALGIPPALGLNAFRPGQLDTILRYHIVGGQKVTTDSIALRSPNLQLPSLFQLAPPSASLPPGLRMSVFAGKNLNIFWLNNIPLQGPGVDATNGIVYPLGFVALPPSTFLWTRISSDPNMTYFKAAILRADSGATAATSLVAGLSNPAANLTTFIPTDAAVKQLLTAQITAALIAQGATPAQAQAVAKALASTPDVFNNPLLFPVLTAQTVKGLVVYHLFGSRVFSVNMPITPTPFKTLLNSAIPTHPGVTIEATFGTGGVTAATVRGAVNASASNILINPTPGAGTSDQHYINGVLHEIDQVLLPQ